MDKSFWQSIRSNKYAFPAGHDLIALTDELFSYIPSTDPDLRDGIGYEVFANWIETEPYSSEALRGYLTRLLGNLQIGLGESGTDTVFGRAFSALFLAEVIHRDNQQPYLEAREVTDALDRVLQYLAAENDPRGFVPGKGWAHALAHTADALMVFARSPHVDANALAKILDSISSKMRGADSWVYVHGEDDRLARAIVTALGRGLLPSDQARAWSEAFVRDWKGAWETESRTTAFFNVRNLLRAVHLRVLSIKELPYKEELTTILLDAITLMRPY